MRRKSHLSYFRHFYVRIPASFRLAALYKYSHLVGGHGQAEFQWCTGSSRLQHVIGWLDVPVCNTIEIYMKVLIKTLWLCRAWLKLTNCCTVEHYGTGSRKKIWFPKNVHENSILIFFDHEIFFSFFLTPISWSKSCFVMLVRKMSHFDYFDQLIGPGFPKYGP